MYLFSELLALVAEWYTFHLFLNGIFYKKSKPTWVWLCVYFIAAGLIGVLSFIMNASFLRLGLCAVEFVFIACFLFEAKLSQAVFASLSFCCIYVLTDVLTIGAFAAAQVDTQAIMSYGMARAIVITVSHTILLVFTLIVLALTKRKRTAITLPFLLAMTPGGAIGIILGIFFCKTVETTGTDLPVSFVIAAIGLLYLNILIVFYAERTQEANERRHKAELAEQHYAMQEQYYAQLREDQNETRAMFHDINKYLRAMRALASEANTEEASQVFAEAQDLVESLVSVVDVGNTVISVILNDYKTQTEEQNIRFDYDVSVPAYLGITAVDAYVIMGNTLDNAIEACCSLPEEDRYIQLQLRVFHDILYYQIENPYAPEYLKKAKKKGHGYGLQNVRRCVEKHKGDMTVTDENGKFVLALRINHNASAAK